MDGDIHWYCQILIKKHHSVGHWRDTQGQKNSINQDYDEHLKHRITLIVLFFFFPDCA